METAGQRDRDGDRQEEEDRNKRNQSLILTDMCINIYEPRMEKKTGQKGFYLCKDVVKTWCFTGILTFFAQLQMLTEEK